MKKMPDNAVDYAPLFWARVDRSNPDACWLWPGLGSPDYYGKTCFRGMLVQAHRMAFFLSKGEWPNPICRHTCDIRACVNPQHLLAGTKQDNANDKMQRGRHKPMRGEDSGRAKLSAQEVIAIREMRGRPLKEIAQQFGVSKGAVKHVLAGTSWRHLEEVN